MPELTPLRDVADFDRLLADSARQPVLLFKHSDSCGTSAEALDELLAHLEDRAHLEDHGETRFAIVTVQTDRAVSNAISARLGVRHETPQALLVRDGRVVWSASHFRVTAGEIARAIARDATQADDQAH
jgi:bacillithiol system protein YtxJ